MTAVDLRMILTRVCKTMCRHWIFLAFVLATCVTACLQAHDGRRFEIEVRNDSALWAQGSIGGGIDDGGGVHRPYFNAIHDHWMDAPGGKNEAFSTLPAWDIFNPDSRLLGHSISLELTDVYKWSSPPMMPAPGTIPDFQPIGLADEIEITTLTETLLVSDGVYGALDLVEVVDVHGHIDLPFEYKINQRPEDEIYVFEWRMLTSAPDILDSLPVYAILSPDGATPEERLHHASLYTEQYLGFRSVPEPSGLGVVIVLAGWLAVRRQKKR